ncbi:hypothetical protein [Halovenus sp. HT40]|uniref:hypothetical protein n=1 Tax=Halovenus sp. HT40 TaxID=3126691 RepID=UPI00300E86F6
MREATVQCLQERPEIEDTLETIVELDEEGPWAFDDLDCDSGNFGYLVSREFVEEAGGGYRLVDREATRAALQMDLSADTEPTDSEEESSEIVDGIRQRVQEANTGFYGSVAVGFLLLFLVRIINYQSVFRDGRVVAVGNDPYYYRITSEELLAASPDLFAFSEIAEVLGGQATGEPLTHVLGWWLMSLAGGADASGFVVAWFPVVSSLVVGLLTAWIALVVTNDERITVLSVLFFAVMPSHALYSGIGFFDHHPFDYLWLAVMAASLVLVARNLAAAESVRDHLTSYQTLIGSVVFGIACAAAMLSWNGSPLLLIGVGFYAVLLPASEVRTEESPLLASLPVMSGLALAGVLTHQIHSSAGWQEAAVVYAPVVVLVGALGVALAAEAASRFYPDPRVVLGGVVGVGVASFVGLQAIAPEIFSRYSERFTGSLLGREGAVETLPLISANFNIPFGPVHPYGWFVFFAVPALAYVSWQCVEDHDPRWLVLVSYAWAFLGLSIIQARFLAEFSPFAAVFTAVGVVGLLTNRGLVKPLACFGDRPRIRARPVGGFQNINKGLYISFSLVVILTLAIIAIPSAVGPLAIEDGEYEAAAWIENDLEDRDSEEYVLSTWGRNRMYNYIASDGERGKSYGYARSTHEDFLNSEDPDEWYGQFENRVGYVVVENRGGSIDNYQTAELTTYGQLVLTYGSATQAIDGVAHFRLVHATEDRSQLVYRPVPGATINGTAEPGTSVVVKTDVEVSGGSFTYNRRTTATENGTYNVTVSYPGEYELPDGTSLEITEKDVEQGARKEMRESEQQSTGS